MGSHHPPRQNHVVHILDNIEGPVFIPYTGNKLKDARVFVDGRKVPFSQTPDGIILKPGSKPHEVIDMVVQLTFQNEI